MVKTALSITVLALAAIAPAIVFVSQTPAANGGTMRWSKLWIDEFGGNDSDSDAICYEDFTLSTGAEINHIEWWGSANPDRGFDIEFWKQDPGTIAYQPIAVFRNNGAQPAASLRTMDYTYGSDPSNTTHFSLDLTTPITLAANDSVNPRWFMALIYRTTNSSIVPSWAQGMGGSTRTFQWQRADANNFRVLSEGRAMLLSGNPVPEPATLGALAVGLAALLAKKRR